MKMLIEIHGAGFQNKGAELMLRTAVTELKQRLPQCLLAIDPTYGAYDLRCGLALLQIVPPRCHVGTPGFARRLRRQELFAKFRLSGLLRRVLGAPLDMYGLVDLSRVSGLIDIAGFAYTDQWGARPTQDLAALTRYYKSRGKPVILLPQAFGPFEQPATRAAFAEVLEHADLVCARDKQSWEYAAALTAHPEKILLSPDITFFSPTSLTPEVAAPGKYACVVPNVRMLDQGKREWGDKYEAHFSEITKTLISLHIPVQLVVHDTTGGDLQLAESIARQVASPEVTVVCEPDPLILKRIIGQSSLLVGSRYHSLVAAFASGVPAISIGWSHKYAMLFSDFNCERFVIAPECLLKTVLERVRELADPATNAVCRQKITLNLETLRLENETMWQRVAAVLTAGVH
jgi:polysaccharide pyruvyl transferase WcaK-like protein